MWLHQVIISDAFFFLPEFIRKANLFVVIVLLVLFGVDGSYLRFFQRILDPLQQFVADGCHTTRETGKLISEAGFSTVNLQMVNLSSASLLSPHVYGVASK